MYSIICWVIAGVLFIWFGILIYLTSQVRDQMKSVETQLNDPKKAPRMRIRDIAQYKYEYSRHTQFIGLVSAFAVALAVVGLIAVGLSVVWQQ